MIIKLLKIIDIVLLIVLLVVGIETIIKVKQSIGKLISEVRKPLLIRINIINVLTVVLSILTIVIVINK